MLYFFYFEDEMLPPQANSPLSSVSHLLMVSSSSESQKLVVSSSLLITVLELSYPARWRSSRLWPFIRGPGTTAEEAPGKTRGKIFALEFSCLLKSAAKTFLTSRHSLIISRPFHCLDVGQVPHLDGTVIKKF